eukprot:scpid56464/ scgid23458/ Uncharacterized sulfatase yidJ
MAFMTCPTIVWHLLVAVICRAGVGQAARRPGDDRPNFIIYVPDETRAESIGAYGHPFVRTPNLDALAANGTVFKEAHVLHTQCAPSRCAMITGRYMHVLGHRTQTHLVREYEPNFFRYLKDAGYYVSWHGKNDMFSQASFPLSVSNWTNDIGSSKGPSPFKFNETGYYSFLASASKFFGNDSEHNGDYRAVVKSLEFMSSNPPEPFLIFLPGIGAHPSYGAPKDYFDMYSADQVAKLAPLRPPHVANKPKYHDGIIKYRNLESLNQTFFNKINAIYLGQVSYVDWILGQLVKGIDALPDIAKNTAIFVTSDHGDFSGDYHLVEKWPGGMDDILTRVPLIGRIPGGVKGHVVEAPVNVFDLFYTINVMAGTNVTHIHFAKSLLPELMGGPGDMNRTVYSEGGYQYFREFEPNDPEQKAVYANPHNTYWARGKEEVEEGCPRAIMAKSSTHKLVYRPEGVSELYDLATDKRELNNVYSDPKYQEVVQKMEMDLLAYFVKTADVTPVLEDPRGAPKPPSSN